MDDIIIQLDAVRRALGTLNITSTRRNLDVLLGSMQAIDQAITALQQIKLEQKEKEESDNERNDG
ncbi:MAG: hypothetical protein PUK18_02740 [Firmicutes bacterium]|nr:hypothetical protein [Bacillota bacterium]MDY6159359.1 hypothetical protein [Candidatus Faecousia sp.]